MSAFHRRETRQRSRSPPDAPLRELLTENKFALRSLLQDDEFLRKRRRNWARLIAKVWLEDPSLCRSCGKPMPIVAAITSPGQDDVIERILRHLQIWDPPWQRQRAPRARAPPPPFEFDQAPPSSEPELIDPVGSVNQALSHD